MRVCEEQLQITGITNNKGFLILTDSTICLMFTCISACLITVSFKNVSLLKDPNIKKNVE